MQDGGSDADRHHEHSSHESSDLSTFELSNAYPKLRVDRLCDNEVEGALPNVLGYLVKAEEERAEHRAHEEHGSGQAESVAPAPSRHTIRVAVDHQQDHQEEEDPDSVLKDLGKEIRAELKLPGE